MLYLDHKKSHNHNPLSFNKILNPKEKQSQEYAPYQLIRGFSFGKNGRLPCWKRPFGVYRYFFIISQKSNVAK